MHRVAQLLESAGFDIDEITEDLCQASRHGGDYVRHSVSASIQDVGGLKLFVTGNLLLKEVIGEHAYWTSVGREVGPLGMHPASSHCAGGWPVEDIPKATIVIEEQLLVWLDSYRETSALIEMFEDLYFEGERIPLPPKKKGLAETFLRELGIRKTGNETHDVIFRPSFSMYLANLYYGIGNETRALFFIEKWIEARGVNAVDPAYIEARNKLRKVET